MGVLNFLKKNNKFSDGKVLSSSIGFLKEHSLELIRENNINLIEVQIFTVAFPIACYLMIKGNPSKTILTQLGEILANILTEGFIDENKNATDKERAKYFNDIIDLITKRQYEYLELLMEESKKPRGTSSGVNITCGILNILYTDNKDIFERYDPLFAAILMECYQKIASNLSG